MIELEQPDTVGWWWYKDAKTGIVKAVDVTENQYGVTGELVAWHGKRAIIVSKMIGWWIKADVPWGVEAKDEKYRDHVRQRIASGNQAEALQRENLQLQLSNLETKMRVREDQLLERIEELQRNGT